MNVLCPHCLNDVEHGLPVEPVFDLKVAAACLSMTPGHLREWLSQHPEVPKLYYKSVATRPRRMLPARWVQYIQGQRLYVRPAKGAKLVKLGDYQATMPGGIAQQGRLVVGPGLGKVGPVL